MYVPFSKQYRRLAGGLIFFVILAAMGEMAWRAHVPATPKLTDEYGKVFIDYSGKEVRLSQVRAAHVIVFMWASWCPYCTQEIQNLSELKKHYGNTLDVIAVNRGESRVDAKAFTDKLNVDPSLQFLLDPTDALFKSVGGYAMPETLFIDSGGQIVFHQRGPFQNSELIAKMAELSK